MNQYINKTIKDFISQINSKFFKRYSIPKAFVKKNPYEWKMENDEKSYKIGLAIVGKLQVVKDTAESAVKIMEVFYQEEKQFVM